MGRGCHRFKNPCDGKGHRFHIPFDMGGGVIDSRPTSVVVSCGYDTWFGKGLVMDYVDCKYSLVLVETSK